MLDWLIGKHPGSIRNAEIRQPSMTMTDDNLIAWTNMGLSREDKTAQLISWANMLEARLAELDPNYRTYQFGRSNKAGASRDES